MTYERRKYFKVQSNMQNYEECIFFALRGAKSNLENILIETYTVITDETAYERRAHENKRNR